MSKLQQFSLQLNRQERIVEYTQSPRSAIYVASVTFAGNPQRTREEGITAFLSAFGIVPGGIGKDIHEANEPILDIPLAAFMDIMIRENCPLPG